MRLIRVVILFSALVGCSAKKNDRMVTLNDNFHKTDNVIQSVRIVSGDVKSESSVLKRAAPEPILLSPDALREVYLPVFGEKPRTNLMAFFSGTESDDLGGYRVITEHNPRGGRANTDASMVWLKNLSSDYVSTLRRFAADACGKLMTEELKDRNSRSNKLVEGVLPSAEKINSFLSALLGYQEKDKHHLGVEKYRAAFEKMMNTEPVPKTDAEKGGRLRSAYNHLCVALATDVRVYYR